MLKGKYLKLGKLSDDKFEGNHPNRINVGYVLEGFNKFGITEGDQLYLFISLKLDASPQAWTSKVVSFDEKKMILKTANSTYKVVVVDKKDEFENFERDFKQRKRL
jgi:hypothetical protein